MVLEGIKSFIPDNDKWTAAKFLCLCVDITVTASFSGVTAGSAKVRHDHSLQLFTYRGSFKATCRFF